MPKLLAAALAIALAGAASAQTPPVQTPPVQMPPSPKSGPTLTLPKPPVAPTVPKAATQALPSDVEGAAQLAMMRTAQDAQADLKSLMETLADTNKQKAAKRAATSNPCERDGHGASLSCIDGIKRQLSRVKLPAAEKSQIEADLSVLRDSIKDAQYAGSAKQRAARIAEAQQRAERISSTLGKLAEPRAPATAGLPLDKIIPGLLN